MAVKKKADRTGPKKILKMLNKNSIYLDSGTRENMNLILQFLKSEFDEATENRKRAPSYTYMKLSKAIGKYNMQVSYACTLLALAGKVRLKPSKFFCSGGIVRTATKVHYIPPDKRK